MLEERKQSFLRVLEAAKTAHKLENRFEFNSPAQEFWSLQELPHTKDIREP